MEASHIANRAVRCDRSSYPYLHPSELLLRSAQDDSDGLISNTRDRFGPKEPHSCCILYQRNHILVAI
eukprot:424119-Rhodomonas_salina.1